MTIQQALDRCDDLKPNSYSTATKIMWLSEAELLVRNEILVTHEGCTDEMSAFTGFTEDTPTNMALFVDAPYDNLYVYYIQMMIDGMNNDTVRYQNSSSLFCSTYATFSQWYNRTHSPLDASQYMNFMRM